MFVCFVVMIVHSVHLFISLSSLHVVNICTHHFFLELSFKNSSFLGENVDIGLLSDQK